VKRLLSLTVLCLLATTCFAQFETATVLGTVKDATGAVVAGAKVTLENVKTGVTAAVQTNDTGNFDFVNVQIGVYRVRAEAPGFTVSITENFAVAVSARQRVDVNLAVGDITQTISVKDAAATLETESSDRGQ